jgi:hypothetical protein
MKNDGLKGTTLLDSFYFRLFLIIFLTLPIYSMFFNLFYDAEEFDLLAYRPWSELLTWFKGGNFFHYIPFPMTVFTIEHHILSENPISHRILSYILHICCTLLVYKILTYTAKKDVAFTACLLYTTLPCHLETVVTMNHRQDLFYTLFSLLATLFFVKYIRAKRKISYLVYCWIFFLLGIFSKESAIMVPCLLFLYDIFFGEGQKFNKKIVKHLPFFVLGGIYIIYRFHIFGNIGSYGMEGRGPSPYTFGWFILSNFNWYLHKLSQPFPIYTAWIILLIFFHRYLLKNKLVLFAIFWLVLALLPVYPLRGERFLYLASFGYVYLLSDLICYLINSRDKQKELLAKSIDYIKVSIFALSFIFMGYFGYKKSIDNLVPHDHKLLPIIIIVLLVALFIYSRIKFKNLNFQSFMTFDRHIGSSLGKALLILMISFNVATLWQRDFLVTQTAENYHGIHDCIETSCPDLSSATELYLDFRNIMSNQQALTLPPLFFVKHSGKQNYYFFEYYNNRKKFGPIKDHSAYFFDVDNWKCSYAKDITERIKRRAEIERKGFKEVKTEILLKDLQRKIENGNIEYTLPIDLNPINTNSIEFRFAMKNPKPDSYIQIYWICDKSPDYDGIKSINIKMNDAISNPDGSKTIIFDVSNSLYWYIYDNIKGLKFQTSESYAVEPISIAINQYSKD